ncbi:hypothetical protein EN828_22720 [Mesorhizobium sp. M2D.F.Ca.ET.185.01.1.1]|uniref:hypothetical protein n=1 Tax=unclassified Mesorhizobium TaxID=325217 RepID=UPI000FCAB171|nr:MULTISPECIES: hypothetical protein [unclassified Mesorhizobium]TGP57216.1 hypothetical protein EN873_03750 [bacterium M00.F.Ca.ET.230.01.1.1]TGP77008.1 hypothetical protein EN870_20515 [bacterium M00.F.Ca.ET.227.01.1.1]TGP84865.1 hypothetical protein EN864_28225 [bacterium M00.F.Ca.ET.221.01.1.1]TGP88435.1 hypothetical protein EN865_27525 [bacterium M00.F.Ca.ET.222.01.1.1]TGT68665.1 hypothetical protein EN802_27650 [bacterium M00.F.Ca.ET.159.01.1.1]TGT80499.1 hypothetical protein EN800_269
MSGLLHGTSALRKSQPWMGLMRDRTIRQKRPDGLEPVDHRSVLEPVIRYLALAFIFFQVATTTALATQVVLFEGDAVALAEPLATGEQAQPTSPRAASRMETRAPEHLLIQIDTAKLPAERSRG